MQTAGSWILLAENRGARQACRRVSACVRSGRARRAINPLFVHGPAGTGKSRLMDEVVAEILRAVPDLPVARLLAGELNPGRAEDPGDLEAARQAGLVIVEDVQHLPSQGVEALVGLIDRCRNRQVQLLLTAVQGPAQLDLPLRLTSRLASGLVLGLGLLGPASRRTFLRQRARQRRLMTHSGVLDWLAESTPGSIRQLEGALTRLEGLTTALGRTPDLADVAAAFREDADLTRPTVDRIIQRVGRVFQVEPVRLCSRRRSREVLLPRQVGMYLTRQLTELSLEQIGACFGGRDHSTVLHACRKVEQALTQDPRLSGVVRQLHAELG